MNKEEIIDACLFLQEHNPDIPKATLEFMQDVSLRELERVLNGRGCFSCKHDGNQVIHPSPCTGCGADDEFRNFKIKV